MGKITKVKDINIAKLNNAEYRTFMARYGSLIAGDGGDSESPDEISFDPNDPLGIPAELRTAFDSDFKLLTSTNPPPARKPRRCPPSTRSETTCSPSSPPPYRK